MKLAEVLHEAGLPPGVLQVLTGDGTEISPGLVTDPRIRMVPFTGGVRMGTQVAQLAGLKRLAMEVGSNCPTLVMNDADLDLAVLAI